MAVSKVEQSSVTNQEIANYWKQKRIAEEDHLYAAVKAAARRRLRNLSDHDYQQFKSSLEDKDQEIDGNNDSPVKDEAMGGIKDWWTKSSYAYLNQPSTKLVDKPKRRRRSPCSYLPHYIVYKSIYPMTLTY